MSAEDPQTTMQSPGTAARTRVVVVRGWPSNRNRRTVYACVALLMAIVSGINLGVGVSMDCYYNSYYYHNCDYRRTSFIISGSCFLVSAVCFLVAALVVHNRIRTIRVNQSSLARQPVTVSSGYPGQPVIAVPTQYPPTYHPPIGPAPYPLSTAANQYPPPAGFTFSPQPSESYLQEATKPPPYSP